MKVRGLYKLFLIVLIIASYAFCYASDQQELSQEQVVQACRKAADWQLTNPNRKPFGDWAQGPFINGLFAISKMPGNGRYLDEVIKIGEKEKWGVITTIHPANDHCTPQTWLNPAAIEIVSGCESAAYDRGQRAYVIEANASKIALKIKGSDDSPIFNPAFVISNWDGDAEVTIDGDAYEDYRIGHPTTVLDKDVVIWIKYVTNEEVDLVIEGN